MKSGLISSEKLSYFFVKEDCKVLRLQFTFSLA